MIVGTTVTVRIGGTTEANRSCYVGIASFNRRRLVGVIVLLRALLPLTADTEVMPMKLCLGALAIFALPVVSACVVTPLYGAPAIGTLAIDWSIASSQYPDACVQSAVDAIEVRVRGSRGGVFTRACEAFVIRVDLEAGDYNATAVLLDVAGNPRTTELNLRPFVIYGHDELSVPIDFPPDSFLDHSTVATTSMEAIAP